MREYEATVIVQPEITDEGVRAICDRVDGLLTKNDAIRLLYDDQGRKRLAYEIRNFQKGRYLLLSFLDGGSVVPDLERMLRLEESVLRYLTVQVSDHVEDIEARVAQAAEEERIREERAAERAAREAVEAEERAVREAEEEARRAEEDARRAEAAKAEPAATGDDAAAGDSDATTGDSDAAAGDSDATTGGDSAAASDDAVAADDDAAKAGDDPAPDAKEKD
jgi:small subunit ribosomal protein S6